MKNVILSILIVTSLIGTTQCFGNKSGERATRCWDGKAYLAAIKVIQSSSLDEKAKIEWLSTIRRCPRTFAVQGTIGGLSDPIKVDLVFSISSDSYCESQAAGKEAAKLLAAKESRKEDDTSTTDDRAGCVDLTVKNETSKTE